VVLGKADESSMKIENQRRMMGDEENGAISIESDSW